MSQCEIQSIPLQGYVGFNLGQHWLNKVSLKSNICFTSKLSIRKQLFNVLLEEMGYGLFSPQLLLKRRVGLWSVCDSKWESQVSPP